MAALKCNSYPIRLNGIYRLETCLVRVVEIFGGDVQVEHVFGSVRPSLVWSGWNMLDLSEPWQFITVDAVRLKHYRPLIEEEVFLPWKDAMGYNGLPKE